MLFRYSVIEKEFSKNRRNKGWRGRCRGCGGDRRGEKNGDSNRESANVVALLVMVVVVGDDDGGHLLSLLKVIRTQKPGRGLQKSGRMHL